MRWKLLVVFALSMLAASATVSHAEDDPRLQKILDHWKKLPEDLKSCRLSGQRFVYDSVFQVEKRAEFEIGWEKDGRTIIRLTKIDIPTGARSQRLTPQGKPFSLRSDVEEETWYIPNQQELIQVKDNGVQRFAQRLEIKPPVPSEQHSFFDFLNSLGWIISNYAKPLIIEFPIHPAMTKFPLELNWQMAKEDQKNYWLSGSPRSEDSPHARNFSEVELMIDKSDLTIRALKIIDPAGTTETVYRFDERETNPDFAADAEIFNIHEERLKFLEPYKNRHQTDPLRAPKPES